MSKKIGLVIEREYFTRIKKKSFLLMTFLMPLFFVALLFVPLWMSTIKDSSVKTIHVLDATGKYAHLLTTVDAYQFVSINDTLEAGYRHSTDGDVYATLLIQADLLENPSAISLFYNKQVTSDLVRIITSTLNTYLQDEKLALYNIPDLKNIINESKVAVDIRTIRVDESGKETQTSAEVAEVVGILFTVIIYFFIFVYGGMVMQGVMEEKNSRIIEVMVSSVKPFDLMMGKIIGVGLVGITQFIMWLALVSGLAAVASVFMYSNTDVSALATLPAASPGVDIDNLSQSGLLSMLQGVPFVEMTLYFFVFFIGGYMLFASLFSAIGAAVDSQEDSQQFMLPITALVLFGFYAALYSIQNPHGPLAFWTSLIPLTSPIVMMVRLPFDVPFWQIALSIAILYGTFIATVKFSAKIYRVGILMYGKKPSIKELIKWIRY